MTTLMGTHKKHMEDNWSERDRKCNTEPETE